MRARKPYHKRRPSKKQIALLCGEAWPDDGVDPRYDRPASPSAFGRKTLQLCRQVQRALEHVVAGLCDPALNQLAVVAVEPAPHSGRLLVTLRSSEALHGADVAFRLEHAAGKLRCEVAAAINRRKTPELVFRLILID